MIALFNCNINTSLFFFFLFSSSPSFLFLLLLLLSLFSPSLADVDSSKTPPHMTPSSPPSPPDSINNSPFKPSIAIVVGILTAFFSLTLLLLLYAKHCKRPNHASSNPHGAPPAPRKNSGIDRTIIESLPIFRFCSLRGHKHGLECAVCLARFEPPELLRLLPKCKHAFHVECVDTWLDAHSTCPICRFRVDPEDILLIDHPTPPKDVETGPPVRRILARHSSAGEKTSGSVLSQIVVQRPGGGSESKSDSQFGRRSLDSFSLRKKSINNDESVSVGCFDRYNQQLNQRKDGLLLTTNGDADAGVDKARFEHRIIVSGNGGYHQRWSDVHPSDLLYLRSGMIISDSHRLWNMVGSRPSVGRRQQQCKNGGNENDSSSSSNSSGRSVINSRSVSEITGLNRFSPNRERGSSNNRMSSRQHRERQAGVVSRWLAWISSQSHPGVPSNRTTTRDINMINTTTVAEVTL